MGAVYDATDTRSGRPAALKVLLPEHHTEASRRRFEREARAMMQVSHRNVCAAYDFGETRGGRLFLAMERLVGEDLQQRLQRLTRLSVPAAVEFVIQSAAGLAAAHAAGLLHRDVKPSNLFVVAATDPGGRECIKVVDFGLAVARDPADRGARVTRTGEILGTPAYMSPEQARGEAPDARCDVFALGAVLYHALTGAPPFGCDNALAVLVRMLTQDAVPLRDLCPDAPEPLAAIVASMLSRDVEGRPESMVALARRLEDVDLAGLATADMAVMPTEVAYNKIHTLVGEQRVLTAFVATGAEEPDRIIQVVRDYGGRATVIGRGEVVALFGLEELEGDEAERAVQAALACEPHCRAVGVGTGRARQGAGFISGKALATAEQALNGVSEGVVLDRETAARVAGRFIVVAGRVAGSTKAVDARARLPMTGRQAALGDIAGRLAGTFEDEELSAVLLLGPSGIGKTRLAQEALARARVTYDGLRVLVGHGETSRRFSAWHVLATALRDWLGLAEDTAPGECLEAVQQATSDVGAPAHCGAFLAASMGIPLPVGMSVAVDHARREPRVMRDQIVHAFGDLLEAASRQGGVILLLEDVQWADSTSLELIDVLLGRLAECPVFVLMTGREYTVKERPQLFRSPALAQREIGELSRKAAGRLARSALGTLAEQLGEQVISVLAEHSGGNPFFVVEIAEQVAKRARAFGREGFDPEAFVLPLTVEAAVQSRLDHLQARDKDLLKRASVVGDRFWCEALEHLGIQEPRPSLERLRQEGLVERPAKRDQRLGGFDEYGFRHRVMRTVAYGMLTEAQSMSLHRLAGEWLGGVAGAPPEEIARHMYAGGDPEGAAARWSEAAAAALRAGNLAAALERLDMALSTDHEREMEAGLRLRKVSVAWQSGNHAVAQDELGLLGPLTPLQDVAQRAEYLFWSARCAPGHPHDAEGLEPLRAAAELYRQLGDPAGEARALGRTAVVEAYSGTGDGRALAERAVRVAGEDVGARARALDALGMVLIRSGALGDARSACSDALEAADLAGDLGLAAGLLGDLAYIHLRFGHFQQAADALEDVVRRAGRIGSEIAVGYARHNLGLALLRLGRAPEALEVEDRALSQANATGNLRLASYCQLYRAQILTRLDRLDEAKLAAQATLLYSSGTPEEPSGRATLAAIHLAAGRIADGLEEAERAQELRRASEMMEHEAELISVHAQLLLAAAREEDAAEVLAEGVVLLETKAAQLAGSDADRETFLRAFPAHRTILELAEAHR